MEAWVGGAKLPGAYHLFSIPRKFKSYGVGGRQRTGVGGSLPRPLYTVPREDWDNPTSSRLLLTLDWASQAPDL